MWLMVGDLKFNEIAIVITYKLQHQIKVALVSVKSEIAISLS